MTERIATRTRDLIIASMQKLIVSKEGDDAFNPDQSIILLSGGVDSAIVAHLAYHLLGVRSAVTVIVTPSNATDLMWAEATAKTLPDLKHVILRPSLDELLEENLSFMIKTLKVFDPMSLRNSICALAALFYAKKKGFKRAFTGDAADELLGGYSFTSNMEKEAWRQHRSSMVETMHYDAIPLGEALGIACHSPFLDPDFIDFAMTLNKEDCIGPLPLVSQPPSSSSSSSSSADAEQKTQHVVTGKLPLRHAFPESPSAYRRKDPAEIGCGTTLLGAAPWAGRPKGYFDDRIDDTVHQAAVTSILSRHGIQIRDKEHLAYFRVFESLFATNGTATTTSSSERETEVDLSLLDVPGKPRPNDDPCPACHFHLGAPTQTFCVTCGHYDAKLASRHDDTKKKKGLIV